MSRRSPSAQELCAPTPAETPAAAHLDAAYRAHRSMLFGQCRRILRDPDEAQDVLHETFMRGLSRAASLRPGPELLGWLSVVARRLCWRRLREASNRQELAPPAPAVTTDLEIEKIDARRALADADAESTARIIVGVLVEGMTHVEAAVQVNLSERTVRNRLSRFLAKARGAAEAHPGGAT